MSDIYEELVRATKEAKKKHRYFPLTREAQFTILAEEIGEIAEVCNDRENDERFKREVLDAGAVIVRILEVLKGVEVWK